MRALSHLQWVCVVLFPRIPLACTLCYIQWCYCMRAFPHKHRVCAVLFSRLSCTLCYILMLLCACFFSQTSGLCSANPSALLSLRVLLFSVMFLCACFASQTPGLCSAVLSTPLSCTHYYVLCDSVMLLSRLHWFANAGLVQKYYFGSVWLLHTCLIIHAF